MAFVNRSKRKLTTDLLSPTKIGPGEYENEETKQKARILHKLNNKYTHSKKLTPLDINIPFNSTVIRKNIIFNINTNTGPGAYLEVLDDKKEKNKLPVLKDEIIFVEENGNLIPKIKNEKTGFLSSEKRFFEKIDINNNNNDDILGINKFRFSNSLNKEKTINNRYGKNIIGNITHRPLDISIPTIPDKNRGDFKMVNGMIEEIKKNEKKDENEVGPGKYNIFPNWDKKTLNWNYGYNKELKNTSFKNDIVSNLSRINSQNINNLSMNLDAMKNKKIKKSISNSNILNAYSIKDSTEIKNMSMRNQVFNRHIKDRKKILTEQMNNLKMHNDIINQIQYEDTPGPGFYYNKIIKHPVTIFNTNKTQNFGSNTPKFSKINNETGGLGPGAYFLEKNKFQPKIDTSVHIKKPKYKNIVKNKVGLYIDNFRKKNKYYYPGPGQYDLSKNFIKDEISNVKSFGILSQRFKINKYNDNTELDDEINRQLYQKTNFEYEDKLIHKINKKILEMNKQEEEYQKRRRERYMNKKTPGVGDYSPEFVTSMSYNVLSKVNTFRNKVAPFNIKNSRFNTENKILKRKENPGPGEYNVENAYEALNNLKIKSKKYIRSPTPKIKINEKNETPGPGLYDQDLSNSWNKKSFNVIFMEK